MTSLGASPRSSSSDSIMQSYCKEGKKALEESEDASMSLVVVCDDKVLSWPEFFLEYEGNLSHYLF